MRQRIRLINDRICVGVDLHKDTLTAAVLDPRSGEVSFTKLARRCREQIVEFFGALPRPNIVAIEAVGFYRWWWDLLDPIVDELVLADATQCRALAGQRIKTDREDASNVAELLAVDCPSPGHRRRTSRRCETSRATVITSVSSMPASCTGSRASCIRSIDPVRPG